MEEKITTGRAVLVSIARSSEAMPACEESLRELTRLLDTAGGETFATVVQVKENYDPATCIGRGKVQEIADLCRKNDIHLAVFDFDLTPSQIRNLEDAMEEVRVIDRSMLILDIFAAHAVSGEGKLQVELAQLKYSAPRLTGQGAALSRLGGTIGTRGPGETKLETDRRHIHRRVVALEAQIAEMEKNRATMRASRDRSGIPKVAIVGYTNAGKSTLLNRLTQAGVLSEDKLFATLDPTTRKLTLPEGESILLTDTVGFIRNLPHHLIKAFRSTLDEAVYADVLLLMADASDPACLDQLEVTRRTLADLGATGKPTLVVYNKADQIVGEKPFYTGAEEKCVFFSAKTGEGVNTLLATLEQLLREGKRRVLLCFGYEEQAAVAGVYQCGRVEQTEYREDGIYVTAVLDRKGIGRYRANLRKGE